MAEINEEYKDRLFSFIFGQEKNRAWTLELYNAVNGSDYQDPAEIEITTIREVLYLGMRNDVSFMISDEMNLYEQQSTYNPNMLVRQLQYCGYLYEKYIKEKKLNKYGSRLLTLPVPRLVVFYNGTQNEPDEKILRLSDSFPEGADADVEVRVRMVNINYGRSPKLLGACRPLQEYSWLIAEIRRNGQTMEIERAVDRAVTDMPPEYVLKPFLEEHRAEVKGMMLMEYNEAEQMNLFKEEGRAEGRQEGMAKGKISTLIDLVKDNLLSLTNAAKKAGMSVEAFQKLMTSGQSGDGSQ